MTEQLIPLQEFLRLRTKYPVIDVRSEGEFAHSHIPDAVNLPILANEERAIVGTLYKQQGSQQAILKGFELVGPRFHQIQKEAISLFPEKKALLYCWRGGMRSQILSWLLSVAGFEIHRLKGGYKAYRSLTHHEVRQDRNLIVLGGKTGTGKTILLRQLKEKGEQVIDLEELARHKGSSFGGIGQKPQPSVEQFENLIAEQLRPFVHKRPVWVENESRKIGKVILPDRFFELMCKSSVIAIQKPDKDRIKHIKEEYAFLPETELIQSVKRLSRHLGQLRAQQAIEAIRERRHQDWISNILIYYDKSYTYELAKRTPESITLLELGDKSLAEQIALLIQAKNNIYGYLS